MKCHEAKRRLDPFMDGELEVADHTTLLEHLQLCRPCAGVFEGEKRLRAALKGTLGAPGAPAGLAARLSASLGGGGAVLRMPSRRWGLVAAAALLFTIGGALLFSPSPEFQLMAADLAQHHAAGEVYVCGEGDDERRCLCLRCTPDAGGAIRGFFEKHAERDYCAHLAESATLGYAFEGVAAWRCRGEEVLWSTWRSAGGSRVSHALLSWPLAGKPRFESKGGRSLLFYPRGDAARPDLACVFIVEDLAEARRFAKALGLPGP